MKTKFILLTAALAAFHASGQSVVAFSTLGPHSAPFNFSGGFQINGSANPPQPYIGDAFPFTPTVSGDLSQLQIAIGAGNSDMADDLVNISISANGNGNLPGAPLETFFDVSSPGQFGVNQALTTLSSVGTPYLQAGTTYWLAVEPSLPDSDVLVNLASSGRLAPQAQELAPGAWAANANLPIFAFAIQTNAVPESSSIALVILGGLPFIGRLLRKTRVI